MNRVAILVAVLAVAVLGATAVSTAGDQTVRIGFESESVDAQPGETVEMALVATTEGGHADQGIADSTVRFEYPGEYLDVVALEAGPYLEDDEARLETELRVNNSAGVAELDQELPGTREGVIGTGYLAFVTFELSEDAPESLLEIVTRNSEFSFAVSDFPVPVLGESGEIVVGDGGETIEPEVPENVEFDDGEEPTDTDETENGDGAGDDGDGSAGSDDSATADEGSTSTDSADGEEDADDGSSDGAGPGFGLVSGLVAAVLAGILYRAD